MMHLHSPILPPLLPHWASYGCNSPACTFTLSLFQARTCSWEVGNENLYGMSLSPPAPRSSSALLFASVLIPLSPGVFSPLLSAPSD